MISVQDLGDGMIGGNYYDTPLTPGLDTLLSDFSHYKNNVSASSYAAGLDVIMSSSVYAPQYSAALVGLRGYDVNTLGKILSDKGFYTLAVTSGPKGAYGGSKTYKSFGYDHFITVSVDDLPQKSVYDAALGALKNNDDEYFFLSITDLGLYTGVSNIKATDIAGSEDVAAYAKRMAYADSNISKFIEDLKAEGTKVLYARDIVGYTSNKIRDVEPSNNDKVTISSDGKTITIQDSEIAGETKEVKYTYVNTVNDEALYRSENGQLYVLQKTSTGEYILNQYSWHKGSDEKDVSSANA
jgi:phosphoglycerol transferase MdoB-like AlkP superfamily enzyme